MPTTLPTFTSSDFNAGRRFTAESLQDAGHRVAQAIARRRFGRRCYARTCNLNSWSQDRDGDIVAGHFQATMGHDVRTGPGQYDYRTIVHGEESFTVRVVAE